MGRGVSSGGGQSSLGYLFGSNGVGDIHTTSQSSGSPKPAATTNNEASHKHVASSSPIDRQIPAGIHGNPKNNYFRVDGQNCGNFLTDRPFTKVHAAPGGTSSLSYLFGNSGN